MENTRQDRCKNMVLGALVADAAAMGLHWIYDQDRIRTVAPEAPEFITPNPKHYEGVPAFFAHPNRAAGAFSQYGEQTMVMLRTLAAADGHYDRAAFAEQFRAHFGYGGAYCGYIDHATRDTLDNFRRFEDAVSDRAQTVPFDGDPKVTKTLIAKAVPLIARHSGQAVRQAFEREVRSAYDDEDIVNYAKSLLEAVSGIEPPSGARDLQLPAIAKLPALIAVLAAKDITEGAQFDTSVASAVRATSNHSVAATFGKISAHMMAGAVVTGTCEGAISAGRTVAPQDAGALLDQAIALKGHDTLEATRQFGMACDLPFGVPSVTHNIITTQTFTDAVRRNIYAGGDSCGRAILVGAIMGAVHGTGGAQGIPEQWLLKLEAKAEVDTLLNTLFG